MRKIAERKGTKVFKFDDEKDLYDYIYESFHDYVSDKRGEDVYISDNIIAIAFDIIIDEARKYNLEVVDFYFNRVYESILEYDELRKEIQ